MKHPSIPLDSKPLLFDTTYTLEKYINDDGKKRVKRTGMKEDGGLLPKRYSFALLSFFGVASVYAMRVNLSVAILAMTNVTREEQTSSHQPVDCPALVQKRPENATRKVRAQRFPWTEEVTNRILGSFFYGYVLTQVPGGYAAERLGGKHLFGGGILATALLTLATPLTAGWGARALIANRVLQGLAEGITKPSMNSLISRWSPKQERSRVSSFIFSGGLIGTVATLPASGWLANSEALGGWPSIFYIIGSLSMIWFVFWIFLVHESPLEHPHISEGELRYLEENQDTIHKAPNVPWSAIFTSLPVWALVVSHFGSSFGFLTLFTVLPIYMMRVLHFNLQQDSDLSALPFLCQALGAWTSAYAADSLRQAGTLGITSIRKIFNTLGLLGAATLLFCVTLSGCRPVLVVTLVCLAMAVHGSTFSGFQVTHIDMSPDFAGVLFGITNSIADLSGILGPALLTKFTYHETTTGNWNSLFYLICLGYVTAAIFYLLFASAELQPWGLDDEALSIKESLMVLASSSSSDERLSSVLDPRWN